MRGKLTLIFFLTLFFISFVSAVPQLTIHSPESITYDTTSMFVNVTASETVDFFFREGRRDYLILEDVKNLESYIFAANGEYNFTIWAKNLNGETSESVVFRTTASNPIDITDCGYLLTSDAIYRLQNNIGPAYKCLYIRGANMTIRLKNYKVEGIRRGIVTMGSYHIHIRNGRVVVPDTPDGCNIGSSPWALDLDGSKIKLKNLTVKGYIGVGTWYSEKVLIDETTIRSSKGLYIGDSKNIYVRDSAIRFNNEYPPSYCDHNATGLYDAGYISDVTFENSTISNDFGDNRLELQGIFIDIFFRNTDLRQNKIKFPTWRSESRLFKQHLVLINVTDEENVSMPSSVWIYDKNKRKRDFLDKLFEPTENPNAFFFLGTDDIGYVETWLTEVLRYVKNTEEVEEPIIQGYHYSPYNITVMTGNITKSEVLDLTDYDSTIPLEFVLETQAGAYSKCTISEMFDLNNDGNVNILDALIILRYITGKQVSISETKNCTGINLNPF